MSKGIKAHIISSILFLIPFFIIVVGVKNIDDGIYYSIAMIYFVLQLAIGMINYLDGNYVKNHEL